MSVLNPKLSYKQREKRRKKRVLDRAQTTLEQGSNLAKGLSPELFDGTGLGRLNQDDYTGYIDEGKAGINSVLSKYNATDADVMGRLQSNLEGLNSAENTALRERAYSGVDRARQAAMSDLARQQSGAGLGGGANFAQQRATARDFDMAKGQLEQGILLDNVNVKRQALQDYAAGNQAGFATRFQGQEALNALGQQGANIGLGVDQFNLGQNAAEISGRAAAMAAGVGLYKDEADALAAERAKKEAMAYYAEQERLKREAAAALARGL